MYLYTPTNNATAQIVTLPNQVASGSPGGITSALRLQTGIGGGSNLAQVYAFVSPKRPTTSPILGLFNGMLFKDMVASGIRFEYSFFNAGSYTPAPAIKMTVYSPSTTNWTTFVWEPYQGQVNSINIQPDNVWVSNVVLNTTGISNVPPVGGSGRGWRNTRWPPIWSQATLANWVTHLNNTMPKAMTDAIVEEVQIGVGTNNDGVTSYVNSLRIAVGDYDWKWTFGG